MSIGKHMTIYINSKDRIAGTSSNFDYNLTQIDDLSKYDRVALLWCTCAKSYYLIEDNVNDTFLLEENGDIKQINLDQGNYTFNTLAVEIQNKLNAVSTYTYTVAPNVKLAKYIITVTNNSGVQPVIVMNSYLNEVIGFEFNTSYTFNSDSLISPNVVRLQRTEALSLFCNIVNTPEGSLQELFTANQVDSSIFQVHNLNPYQWSHPIKKLNTNVIHFELRDYNTNQIVGLNGLNIQMQLMFYRHDFSKEYHLNRAILKDNILLKDDEAEE